MSVSYVDRTFYWNTSICEHDAKEKEYRLYDSHSRVTGSVLRQAGLKNGSFCVDTHISMAFVMPFRKRR